MFDYTVTLPIQIKGIRVLEITKCFSLPSIWTNEPIKTKLKLLDKNYYVKLAVDEVDCSSEESLVHLRPEVIERDITLTSVFDDKADNHSRLDDTSNIAYYVESEISKLTSRLEAEGWHCVPIAEALTKLTTKLVKRNERQNIKKEPKQKTSLKTALVTYAVLLPILLLIGELILPYIANHTRGSMYSSIICGSLMYWCKYFYDNSKHKTNTDKPKST